MLIRLLIATLVLASPFSLAAQEATKAKAKAKKKAAPERPEPTVADFAYGTDPRGRSSTSGRPSPTSRRRWCC